MMRDLGIWLLRVIVFGALIIGIAVGIWRRDIELALTIILGTIVAVAFLYGMASTLSAEIRAALAGNETDRDVYGRARFSDERKDAERGGLR